MKKARVLVIAIAVALMAMGIGYAAWSQTLPMNVDGETTHIDVKYVNSWVDSSPYVATTTTIMDSGKKLDVQIKNMYPNAGSTFSAVIKNNGTMPVILKSISLAPKSSWKDPNWANLVVRVSSDSPAFNFDLIGPDGITPSIRFEPGAEIRFAYTVKMADVGNLLGENLFEDEEFGFVLTPNFETTVD